MRATQLIQFLAQAFTNHRQVLVKGSPGVGKSDVIDEAIRQCGADSLIKHPSVEDPVDAKGLPGMDTIDGVKVARFFPFDDLHRIMTANRLLVVHLEDFGQAFPATQSSYMQLLLRRELAGKRISDHAVFVASTNDITDAAGVGGLLEPVKSRFHTIVKLEVSLDDWVLWAIDHNMPPWLVSFIRKNPEALSEFKPTKALTNSPCPRTWASVGQWDNQGVASHEVWAGCVGEGRAAEAIQWREAALNMPDPDACLLDPDNAPLPEGASMRYAMAIAIAYRVTGKNFDQAIRYTNRIGKDLEVLTVTSSIRKNPKLAETTGFARWASDPVNRDISL